MAILNIRSVPTTSDQNSNRKPLIQMVYEEQTDIYCQPDTSVSENKDTLWLSTDVMRTTHARNSVPSGMVMFTTLFAPHSIYR